ncbi:AraC-type DNA-binding protein [Salegentibacter echinorum]|uniref:AraC-type DNA-binding protein n=1 Tax=Salegentibacter echinorum TaxID=1073325 RepID=A0A1M5KBK3_SALEC|nr:helix-turn-helix domain-containing protein [Salegentibacter echinorum]SHG50162.1 AraC-type DNA-binding protein [Salegentibacter echinorum]
MNIIQSNSIPLDKVIMDISDSLNTKLIQECSEFTLEIPPEWGEGTIKAIDFQNGLGLIRYDCTFKEDLEIRFIVNDVHPLKFLYGLEGEFHHRFENEEELHKIKQYQNAIVASSGNNGHILYFKGNNKTAINSLEVTRFDFREQLKCELKTLEKTLSDLFNDVKAVKSFYFKGYYSLVIAHLFNKILDLGDGDFARRIFLEGIAYNMLGEEILHYQDSLKKDGDGTKGLLSRIEVKLIDEATLVIKNNLGDLGTIEDISKQVGLNANKLQDGFQKVYGKSVNGYVKQERLDLASYLLLNTDKQMGEIVEIIGLNSKSYFSKIFREAYGVSPLQFRKTNFTEKQQRIQKKYEK